MSTPLGMPSLGLTMEEGMIVEWLKKEGDRVEQEEPVLLIETDKATVEVTAPQAGILGTISAQVGDAIPVGQTIAIIYTEQEYADGAANRMTEPAKQESQSALRPETYGSAEQPEAAVTDAAAQGEEPRIKSSPAARKLAALRGIDLQKISGNGPGGRILESDVMRHVEHASLKEVGMIADTTPRRTTGSISVMRKTIARRMMAAGQTTAPVTIFMDVRMDEAIRLRAQMNTKVEEGRFKISYDALFAKAAAGALRSHPMLQAQWSEEGLLHPEGVHIGIAVALPEGLVVPVIRDACVRSLFSITEEIPMLAAAARNGGLSPEAMSGGTFTISNLGMYPVDGFTPIINLPQTAILGIGTIKQVPWMENDRVIAGHVTRLSLTFDHRVVDGAPAAAFLTQIKEIMESPYRLFLEN